MGDEKYGEGNCLLILSTSYINMPNWAGNTFLAVICKFHPVGISPKAFELKREDSWIHL